MDTIKARIVKVISFSDKWLVATAVPVGCNRHQPILLQGPCRKKPWVIGYFLQPSIVASGDWVVGRGNQVRFVANEIEKALSTLAAMKRVVMGIGAVGLLALIKVTFDNNAFLGCVNAALIGGGLLYYFSSQPAAKLSVAAKE